MFFALTNRTSCASKCMKRSQPTAITFVLPRDRPVSFPSIATKKIKAAVISRARKGVGLKYSTLGPSLIGEDRPRKRRGREGARHFLCPFACREERIGSIAGDMSGRWAAEEILSNSHKPIMAYFYAQMRHFPPSDGSKRLRPNGP